MSVVLRKKENDFPTFGDAFFDEFLNNWELFPRMKGEQEFSPRIDFREDSDKFVVHAELAGIESKDVNVEFNDGLLTIQGERKETKEDQEIKYREIRFGKFSRSFRVPGDIDEEKVEASLKDGILSISLPKKEKARLKKIPINAK